MVIDHHNSIFDLWIALFNGHHDHQYLDITMNSNYFLTSKTICYTLQQTGYLNQIYDNNIIKARRNTKGVSNNLTA